MSLPAEQSKLDLSKNGRTVSSVRHLEAIQHEMEEMHKRLNSANRIGSASRSTNHCTERLRSPRSHENLFQNEHANHSGPTVRDAPWQKQGCSEVFEADGVRTVYCGEG